MEKPQRCGFFFFCFSASAMPPAASYASARAYCLRQYGPPPNPQFPIPDGPWGLRSPFDAQFVSTARASQKRWDNRPHPSRFARANRRKPLKNQGMAMSCLLVCVASVPDVRRTGDVGHHCREVGKSPGTASHGAEGSRKKSHRNLAAQRKSRPDAGFASRLGDGCPPGSCNTGGMSGGHVGRHPSPELGQNTPTRPAHRPDHGEGVKQNSAPFLAILKKRKRITVGMAVANIVCVLKLVLRSLHLRLPARGREPKGFSGKKS